VCDPWCSIARDEDTGISDGVTSDEGTDGDAASDGASEATTDAPAGG
jgi:hypothetical protein